MSEYSDQEFEYEYDYEDDVDSMDEDGSGSIESAASDVVGAKMSPASSRSADDNPRESSSNKYRNLNARSRLIGELKDTDSLIKMTNAKDLVPQMWTRINGITEVLDIPSSAAIILLRQHKWEKERLFDAFYSDPEKAKVNAGVLARCSVVSNMDKNQASRTSYRPNTRSTTKAGLITCEICYDEFLQENMFSMPCGHEFCYDCWGDFISNMIDDGPTCIRTTCPLAGCNETVTEQEIEAIAPQTLDLYKNYQLRSYVELSGTSRWCPGPGCERIATIDHLSGLSWIDDSATGIVATCDSCTTSFCVKCGEEPHAPLTCRVLSKWIQKCENESETANWILANTKSCPMCSTRIEKNQGCNHMTCQKCRHEFCWICMGKWEDHGANTGGYYKCNKFDSDEKKGDHSDVAKAKRELDRYLHYYKRYHAHSEAQKFAKKQLKETESRMVLLQESTENATWTDVEFLKVANEQLVDCRRVLKYTYCFAYYMPLPPSVKDSADYDDSEHRRLMQKERFEHHQEMLERFTENLSELAEKPLQSIDRVSVVNQTRVVDRFMKNILQYVDDGMGESEN